VQISFTSITDVAGPPFPTFTSGFKFNDKFTGFLAYILTSLPPSELENRVLRLEGERASLKDLAAQFKTSVERVDSFPGEGGQIKTALHNVIEAGAGSTGWDWAKNAEGTGSNAAGSANALWPGHQWKSIKEVHNL
jgi:hypothetical protein